MYIHSYKMLSHAVYMQYIRCDVKDLKYGIFLCQVVRAQLSNKHNYICTQNTLVYLHSTSCCGKYTISYALDFSVKIFLVYVFDAIHLSGILSWREDTNSGVSLERPKSDILSSYPSTTRMLQQARSRWRTPREERYS